MIYFIGSPKLFESEIKMLDGFGELFNFIDNNDEIAVDTETTGFSPYNSNLLLIQFGNQQDQYVIDVTITGTDFLKEIFIKDKLWLFQNAKFDLRFLIHLGIFPQRIYDVMLAEKIIFNGLESEYNLQYIVHKYCNYMLKKEIRGMIHREGNSERTITYASEDKLIL